MNTGRPRIAPTVPGVVPERPAPARIAPQVPVPPVPVAVPSPTPSVPARAKASRLAGPPVSEKVTPAPVEVAPDETWLMSDLMSSCPDERMAAPSRFDPYYDGLWSTGSTAAWLSKDSVIRQEAAGLVRLPARLKTETTAAVEAVLGTAAYSWNTKTSLLGALHSWRTCSAEQLAAFTGDARLLDPVNKLSSSLFASEVIDIGLVNAGLRTGSPFDRGLLYRPSSGDSYERNIEPHLSWSEKVAVSGGQPWASGGHYDRHNVLAVEVALRAAEYTEAATVMGERMSSLDMLAGSGIGRPELVGDRRSGDLTIVREDGLRVVVEVTTSSSARFDRKVEQWAYTLENTPMSESGLVVIFLIAPRTGDSQAETNRLRNRTFQAVSKATKLHPGFRGERTGARIGVASWTEWFPGRHQVSDHFFSLESYTLGAPDAQGSARWTRAGFLDADQVPFTPNDPTAMRAVIGNAGMLGQTPHWMRDGDLTPSLAPLLVTENGLPHLPEVDPKRKDRPSTRRLGEAVGSGGPAGVPLRLRTLAGT